MGKSTLNVTLTPELRNFVDPKVRSGRYQDSSEVAIRAHLQCVHAEDAANRFKPAVQEAAVFLGK